MLLLEWKRSCWVLINNASALRVNLYAKILPGNRNSICCSSHIAFLCITSEKGYYLNLLKCFYITVVKFILSAQLCSKTFYITETITQKFFVLSQGCTSGLKNIYFSVVIVSAGFFEILIVLTMFERVLVHL